MNYLANSPTLTDKPSINGQTPWIDRQSLGHLRQITQSLSEQSEASTYRIDSNTRIVMTMQVSSEVQEISQPRIGKPEISSGTLIDSRYIIQKLLGQGGLGRTYLALDTRRFNEPCVLKELAPCGSGAYSLQKSRNLFKREAEILYRINHPQIPDFLACFEGDGRMFLVQEYVDGKTYSSLLKEYRKQGRRFSEQDVIDWLSKLLPVLNYIHQHGIIHRDISPDNIMLPIEGELPILIDFGVGKQVINEKHCKSEEPDDESDMSYVGKMSLVGKIGYAPHEQIRLGLCSPSSDLYALGVTAVVLLTCRDPYMLMNQYSLQWKWKHYCNVTPEFSQVLDRMLADTPAKRYQTAAEVLSDLQNLEQIELTPLSPLEPTAIPSEPMMLKFPTTVLPPQPLDYPDDDANAGDLGIEPTSPSSIEIPVADHFIQRCQEALISYIGPMAGFIVDEIMNSDPLPSPTALVNRLAQEIPNPQESLAFKKQVFS